MKMTADNATHTLLCTHRIGDNFKDFTMPCHGLKEMPDGRLKILVFGRLWWQSEVHKSRIRYVSPDRVMVKRVK